MRRKVVSVLVCVTMAASGLAGCEKTPEEAIVREKGADSGKEYESAGEGEEGLLRETLGAPEHYQNEAVYEDGGLVVDTDAQVVVPETDTVNIYAVSAKKVDQELIDTVTKAFFEGDKVYLAASYEEMTKADYQEKITRLKKYKADGNLDPYGYGKDENGNLQYDIDQQIRQAEESMQTAPDEVQKEEVVPAMNLEYQSGQGDQRTREIDKDHFGGVVETENGNYRYTVASWGGPDVAFTIYKKREDADPEEVSIWMKGEHVLDEEKNYIPEETIRNKIGIAYEDAKKIAEEKIERLGWDLKFYDWDYSVLIHGEGGAEADRMPDAGYLFSFGRDPGGIPVTQTACEGGGMEDVESTLVPWGYERCEVVVGDDGIQKVTIRNPYDVGEVETEHVKLMDFESIMKIYEQMMEVSNADISRYEGDRTYHIRKITLGYTRIYDLAKDNSTGLLVPAWDFFGGYDTEGTEEEAGIKNSGMHSTQSYLTLNAIDGTVIDREMGY